MLIVSSLSPVLNSREFKLRLSLNVLIIFHDLILDLMKPSGLSSSHQTAIACVTKTAHLSVPWV